MRLVAIGPRAAASRQEADRSRAPREPALFPATRAEERRRPWSREARRACPEASSGTGPRPSRQLDHRAAGVHRVQRAVRAHGRVRAPAPGRAHPPGFEVHADDILFGRGRRPSRLVRIAAHGTLQCRELFIGRPGRWLEGGDAVEAGLSPILAGGAQPKKAWDPAWKAGACRVSAPARARTPPRGAGVPRPVSGSEDSPPKHSGTGCHVRRWDRD